MQSFRGKEHVTSLHLQGGSFQTPLVARAWQSITDQGKQQNEIILSKLVKSSFHKIKLLVALDDIMIRQKVSFGNILVLSLGLNEHYTVSYKTCIVYRKKNVPWIE